jgi:hypothetical protein
MLRILARSVLLAATLSLGAVPPAAAQARTEAERQQVQGLALGLAAVAALGLLIHERNEDRDEERERRARTLPDECLVNWRTRDGAATLYDPDCLDARFEAASRLPLDCAVTVRVDGRFVSGFSPACLREEGWHAAD